jgi:antitoxin component YwqK of YwqJK toxin-antitoxin module
MKEGTNHEYYNNGKVKEEFTIVNGKKEGLHRIWNEESVLIYEAYYVQGKREGIALSLTKDNILHISYSTNDKNEFIPINKVKELFIKSKF